MAEQRQGSGRAASIRPVRKRAPAAAVYAAAADRRAAVLGAYDQPGPAAGPGAGRDPRRVEDLPKEGRKRRRRRRRKRRWETW